MKIKIVASNFKLWLLFKQKGVIMKKIFALLLAIAMLFALSACTDSRAETVLNISGGPVVKIDGDASAQFKDGVLTVTHSENIYIENVTVDGRRVWLTDGAFMISDYDEDTNVEIEAQTAEANAGNTSVSSVILSLYDTQNNSYSVTWHTTEKDCPTVEIIDEESMTSRTVSAYCDEGNSDFVNRAVFYNLDYGKEYTYSIYNSAGTQIYTSDFKTGEEAPESITFMHISDTQDEDYNGTVWAELMDDAYQHTDNIDFILHTGDMVQYGGNEELWSKMISNVENYVSSVPTMLTSGNHSYWNDYTDGATEIEYKHTTVNLPEQDCENGIYYSFDYGDVHFIVLSSGDSGKTGVGKEQREWLKNDLAATDKKWKIVAIHNPLYSPGKYGSSSDRNKIARSQQIKLGEIFNEYGVDLVLQGHDHVFALTKPMDEKRNPIECKIVTEKIGDEEFNYFENPQAPVYLMSAAGGSQNREAVDTYEPLWFESTKSIPENSAGYSVITVSGDRLTSTFYEYNYKKHTVTDTYSWGIDKT